MNPLSVRNEAAGSVLSVFGEIGLEGLQVANFRAALDSIKGKSVFVEINSPGGDVFAGVAIYNFLRGSGKNVTTKVAGYAASAASLVFMAGSQREMPANTYVMVHNARCATSGTAEDLRKSAAVIDQIDATMRSLYAAHTGLSDAALRKMLAVDTWMDGAESLRLRFATAVTDAIDVQASIAPRRGMPTHVLTALTAKHRNNAASTAAIWAKRA